MPPVADTDLVLLAALVGVGFFFALLVLGPKLLVWLVGYVTSDLPSWPAARTDRVQGTQVRTWEHPTEGTQVEVSQVDVTTTHR